MWQEICPLCDGANAESVQVHGEDKSHWKCLGCGQFSLTRTLASAIKNDKYKDKRWILSGVISNATMDVTHQFGAKYNGIYFVEGKEVELHSGNIDGLIKSASIPKNPIELMDSWLRWMAKVCNPINESIYIVPESYYQLVFARNPAEFQQVLNWLEEEKLIEKVQVGNGTHHILTRAGWKRVAELESTKRDSNQAFVATWFDNEMDSVFTKGIMPALEHLKYKPIWMKILEHNGKIDDRILAEIRRSGLVIADFTGNRGGVYYEAGFAQGLGIPVIWMCKDVKKHTKKLHFDTRQYSHIFWNDEEDLKKKLIARIEAVIPGRAQER